MRNEVNRKTLLAITLAILVGQLFVLDYESLFSRQNAGSLLGIVAMACAAISVYLSMKHEQKNNQDDPNT